MIEEVLKYAMSSLWKRRLRSFLTVLSILVGITAIFALISFGQGIKTFVNEIAEEQGTNTLIVMPGTFVPPGTSNILFSDDDVNFLEKVNGVDDVVGLKAASGKVEFKDFKEKYVTVFGWSTDGEARRFIEERFTVEIIKGRDIKKGDVSKAVLGNNYLIPNRLFKKALDAGDKIKINDIEVEVVGFYDEIGNPQDDAQIYMSEEGIEEIFGERDYEFIYLSSSSGVNPTELADKLKDRFRKHKDQEEGEEDFTIQTFEQALETFTTILNVINAVLILIALISVVVAAVNIMNTMYTSILERTSEIGVMKSIGARNKFILFIFMVESGLLGLIGGIIGISLGYLIARLGQSIAANAGLALLRPIFPLWLIMGCLVFALLVGVGSGFLPSLQASKLKPVDALRYE